MLIFFGALPGLKGALKNPNLALDNIVCFQLLMVSALGIEPRTP
jgi:hypothetical protein